MAVAVSEAGVAAVVAISLIAIGHRAIRNAKTAEMTDHRGGTPTTTEVLGNLKMDASSQKVLDAEQESAAAVRVVIVLAAVA